MKYETLAEAYLSLANSALTATDATVFVGGVTISLAVREDDENNANPDGISDSAMLGAHRAGRLAFVGFQVSVSASAGAALGASASLWGIEDRPWASGALSANTRDYFVEIITGLAAEAAADVIGAGRDVAQVFDV